MFWISHQCSCTCGQWFLADLPTQAQLVLRSRALESLNLMEVPENVGRLTKTLFILKTFPSSFSEQPPDSFQYTVFLGIIWVVFARYLEYRRKSIRIRVHSMSYPLCDLANVSAMRGPICEHAFLKRTCWLISNIAMSFLWCVYLSKACSMVEVSVLASTTRKFFWASGGCVTC